MCKKWQYARSLSIAKGGREKGREGGREAKTRERKSVLVYYSRLIHIHMYIYIYVCLYV